MESYSRLLWLLLSVFMMTSLWVVVTSQSTKHVAQVRVYVDSEGINKWTRTTGKSRDHFRYEMNSTFFEVNQIYKSLENYNIRLQLQIQDVSLLNRNVLAADRHGKIVNKESLKQFERWMSPSYGNTPYDMAILFTGYNLVKPDGTDSSYGYAYVGTVCSAKALGVLELSATFRDVFSAAHEIGHIFGAYHDGLNMTSSCSSNSGKVMNPSTDYGSPNHFYFSRCSANSIRDVINRLNRHGRNCMRSWFYSYDIKGPRFASLHRSPDEICKRRFGRSSYIARKAYTSYGDKVCLQLACMTKTVGTRFHWTFVPTPEGMDCGKNKKCYKGKCVQTSGGNDVTTDWCPFGDQPKIEGSFQTTCSKMASAMCPRWKHTCCQSCQVVDPGTADEVCRDLLGKNSAMARRAYSSGYGNNLCSQLSCLTRVEGTRFYWNYYKAPDGMKCGKNKRCSRGKCIWSKVGDPNVSDSCPFGDQPWLGGKWQTTCGAQIKQDGCSGNGWNETCCASCNDPGTADEVCRRREGKNSAMARRAYSYYGNSLCSNLSCLTSVEGTRFYWNYSQAPDGMKCGKNKRCSQGQCVWSKYGDPDISDSCPFGDQPWLGGKWQTTCDQYVRQNGCGGNGWKQTCCSSC